MKLLPEQVTKLKESLDRLVITYNNLKESRKNDVKNSNYTSDGFTDLPDHELAYEINETVNKIHELEFLLATCTIIDEVSSDCIEIGSEFTATVDFFGEEETGTYMLAENCERVEGKNIISLASPFGQSVLGKKENENFSYPVGKNIFNGVVNKIHTKDSKEKTIEK